MKSKSLDNDPWVHHLSTKQKEYWMTFALNQAQLALKNQETPVGCIFVFKPFKQKPFIISKAHNLTNQFRMQHNMLKSFAFNNFFDLIFSNISIFTIPILSKKPSNHPSPYSSLVNLASCAHRPSPSSIFATSSMDAPILSSVAVVVSFHCTLSSIDLHTQYSI